MRKIREVFDGLAKSALLAGGNSKSYGNLGLNLAEFGRSSGGKLVFLILA